VVFVLVASWVFTAAGFAPGVGAQEPSAQGVDGFPAGHWVVEVVPAGVEAAGPPLLQVPLAPGESRVGIVFRHSVEQSPVVEWFEAAKPPGTGFVLVATEYESFGAGLPVDAPPGARFRQEEDRFVIEGLRAPVPQLVLRPLPWTEHRLIVSGVQHDLSQLAEPGTALLVRPVWEGTGPGP